MSTKNITVEIPNNEDFDDIDPMIIKKVITQYVKNNQDIIHLACLHVLNKQNCYTCRYGKDRYSPDSILYCESDEVSYNIVPNPSLLHSCWTAKSDFK